MENNNTSKHHYFYSVGLSYKKADAEIRGAFSLDAAAKTRLLEQAKNEGIESLIKTITKVKRINKDLKHKFFITKLDGRIGSFKEMEDNLRNVLKENVFNTQIRIDNKIRTAQNNSQTIYEIKGSKAAEDYMNLVGEINGTFNI